MAEVNKEEKKETVISKVKDIKFWQFSYAAIASIVTLFGAVFGVYQFFYGEKEKHVATEQKIVIVHDYNQKEESNAAAPLTVVPQVNTAPSNEKVQTEPTAVMTDTRKQAVQASANTVQVPVKKQEVQPVKESEEETDDFGIVKNKNAKASAASTPKANQQVFASAYVLGDTKPLTGTAVKIRLKEDFTDANSNILKNTTLTGIINVAGERVYIELNDKNGNVLYLCDKSKLRGIALQEKIPDGLLVNVTNFNK